MPAPIRKINLDAAFDRFSAHWQPRVLGAVNDAEVKIARLSGPFVWHRHADADELFLVLQGRLRIELRDGTAALPPVELAPGELVIVPRGVEHRPVAAADCRVLLLEPAGTVNTGDTADARATPGIPLD